MSAASFAGAIGAFGLSTFVDWRLLSRPGKLVQALGLLQAKYPGVVEFDEPTIAAQIGCCVKTVRRAFADLARLDTSVRGDPIRDRCVPGGQDCPVPSYVVRESASAPHVERNPGQMCPESSEPLTRSVGRLESDPGSLESLVIRLKREYGADFEPFYRRACQSAVSGQLAIGDFIGAVEEADRGGVKNRGAAFVASIKRRLASKPAPKATVVADQKPVEVIDRPVCQSSAIVEAPPPPVVEVLPVVAPPPVVEVLPTDDEVRFHIDMLGATDDAMFVLAVRTLRLCGRGDLVGPREVARFERVREAMKARLVGGPAPGSARRGRMSGVFPRRPGPEREPAGRALASPPAGT